MQIVLGLCQKNSALLLADFTGIRLNGSVDCDLLRNNVILDCEKAEEKLMNTWFPEIANVFYDKKSLGRISNPASFYACVDTLVSNQLKDLIWRSVEAWAWLFDDANRHCLPLFKLQLVLEDDVMLFYPSLDELHETVQLVATTMSETVQKVPKLYQWLSGGESTVFVDAKIDEILFKNTLKRLQLAVEANLEGPRDHLEQYLKKYSFLVDGEGSAFVRDFIEENHPLEDYVKVL